MRAGAGQRRHDRVRERVRRGAAEAEPALRTVLPAVHGRTLERVGDRLIDLSIVSLIDLSIDQSID